MTANHASLISPADSSRNVMPDKKAQSQRLLILNPDAQSKIVDQEGEYATNMKLKKVKKHKKSIKMKKSSSMTPLE